MTRSENDLSDQPVTLSAGNQPRSISRHFDPYVGGFLLSEDDLGEIGKFTKQELPNGLYWWSDNIVAEELVEGLDQSFLLIRGHWALTSPGCEDGPAARCLLESAQSSMDEFHEQLEYLSGRYVIILHLAGHTYVYNDTLGARTVFYCEKDRLVASHLHLIEEVGAYEKYDFSGDIREVQWAADFTPLRGVFNLLPNFFLEIPEFKVSRFYPRQENGFWGVDREEKYREIERIWRSSQKTYFEAFPNIAFSISGGIDSRLVLAMAKPYWHKMNGYTYGLPSREHSRTGGTFYRRTMLADDRIVRSILESVRFKEHTFFDVAKRAEVSSELAGLLRKNTYGEHGQHLVASYREKFSNGSWLNIRGNAIELARIVHLGTGFDRRLSKVQSEFPDDVEERMKVLGYSSHLHGYGKQLMMYWELRHGKWLGEINNELDAAFDTWIPAANRRILDLMRSFAEEELTEGLVIRDLIDRNAPELNWLPVNSSQTLYQDWRDLRFPASRMLDTITTFDGKGNQQELQPLGECRLSQPQVGPGAGMQIKFAPVKETGTLLFRVLVPYGSASGKGYFNWGVKINGEQRFTIDGAEKGVPVSFSIDNISPKDEVLVELNFLKKVQGAESWSRATRLRIEDCKLYPRAIGDASPELRTDWPSTEIQQ